MSEKSTEDRRIVAGDLTASQVNERMQIAKLEVMEWLRDYILDPHSVDISQLDGRLDAAKILQRI